MKMALPVCFLCSLFSMLCMAPADARLRAGARRHLQDQPLVVVGNNGDPADIFPLQLCQGDCDNDAQCADGLFCLQRGPGDLVPGCIGFLASEADICVAKVNAPTLQAQTIPPAPSMAPGPMAPTLVPTGAMTETVTVSETETSTMVTTEAVTVPTTTVTGAPTDSATAATTDAETAAETEAATSIKTGAPTDAEVTIATEATTTISPTEADTTAETPESSVLTAAAMTVAPTTVAPDTDVPLDTDGPGTVSPETDTPTTTVAPTDSDLKASEVTEPETMPALMTTGNDGSFLKYPLAVCQGDCDEDTDCEEGLVCFQRLMDEPVLGCSGSGDFSIDYCMRDNRFVSSAYEVPGGVVAGGAVEVFISRSTVVPTSMDTMVDSLAGTVDSTATLNSLQMGERDHVLNTIGGHAELPEA